jgi:hypothetical protein
MKLYLSLLILLMIAAVSPAFQTPAPSTIDPTGLWSVSFTLPSVGVKDLTLACHANHTALFKLNDPGATDNSAVAGVPAVWSPISNSRIDVSGEVELPLGTCCREVGTLILKGTSSSANAISGKALFVGTTTDEENFNGFRSLTGTFTATRKSNKE